MTRSTLGVADVDFLINTCHCPSGPRMCRLTRVGIVCGHRYGARVATACSVMVKRHPAGRGLERIEMGVDEFRAGFRCIWSHQKAQRDHRDPALQVVPIVTVQRWMSHGRSLKHEEAGRSVAARDQTYFSETVPAVHAEQVPGVRGMHPWLSSGAIHGDLPGGESTGLCLSSVLSWAAAAAASCITMQREGRISAWRDEQERSGESERRWRRY